jgi:hypothetical protein
MKKILRVALPLGMLTLAFSMPAKASYQDCLDYCAWDYDFCISGCTGPNDTPRCRYICNENYHYCVSTCQ